MSRLRTRPEAGARGGADDLVLDLDIGDIDDLDDGPGGVAGAHPGRAHPGRAHDDGPGGASPVRRRRRGRLLAAGAAVALVLTGSLVRQQQQQEELALAARTAAQAARADARAAAWRQLQERSREHERREVEALALLPGDLAREQRVVVEALEGAAPRLPDLDWSTATTRTVRTTAQRLGDGSPRLVDAQRTARPASAGPGDGEGPVAAVAVPAAAGTQVVGLALGASPATSVSWRISTPLVAPQVSDPCAVPGALPVPDGRDGQEAPVCSVRTTTSPSGEEQVVAVRSWQRLLGSPGDAAPVRVVTVHQAVLLVEQRWTFSIAATAVGSPGSAASVPLLSLDQASLAVRWAAEAARGRPTPAPLRGTPLPGFSG
ncbi:hypothetical protein [Quadrisphaera sp. KR29]|uniref:hypothetical protein n=1 Tax=Quadrisphaera sp. KR29 TaxID=3461391 RepID=UPI00404501B0